MKQESKVMTVTPRIAKEWLENQNNIKNRPIKPTVLSGYIDEMKSGRWVLSGQPIIIDENGGLIDGQHRLRACVESGASFPTYVSFGVKPTVYPVIDAGANRTCGDALSVSNIPNYNLVAAIARLLTIHQMHGVGRITNPLCQPTRSQIFETARLRRAKLIHAARTVHGYRMGSQAVTGFCYYLFREQDEAKADAFITAIGTGIDLKKDNPAYLLRERLMGNKQSKEKLRPRDIIALFFKAWVAYRDGRKISNLRWRTGGDHPEEFPAITG